MFSVRGIVVKEDKIRVKAHCSSVNPHFLTQKPIKHDRENSDIWKVTMKMKNSQAPC